MRYSFLALQLILMFTLGASPMLYGESLFEAINATYTTPAPYQVPTQKELETAQHLFNSLFASPHEEPNAVAWNSLGFEVKKVGTFILIQEKPTAQTGKGTYVFNLAQSSAFIIEVPHRPSDKHTGPIAAHLIEEGAFLAGAWNSVHRKKADLGKEELSYFNAFTTAFGQVFPEGKILQLHGFNEKNHNLEADIILSATLSSPPPPFYTYAQCLANLPASILSYPNSVSVLGGTKNTNAKKFREVTSQGLFLHIEMGLSFRERLLNSEIFRRNFASCFQDNPDF